jgi:hypothetical protein
MQNTKESKNQEVFHAEGIIQLKTPNRREELSVVSMAVI